MAFRAPMGDSFASHLQFERLDQHRVSEPLATVTSHPSGNRFPYLPDNELSPYSFAGCILYEMNEPLHDGELLSRYVHTRSESAFAELVDRYVDLVFSVAIRKLHDRDLAQDVAQQVFMDVARKAPLLVGHRVLAGWLHRAAWFAAAKVLRARLRRESHEREAVAMTEQASDCLPDWMQIAPQLDAAVAGLQATDREAVLLRFFREKEYRTVGQILGLSEEAAKKRVSRALKKLRVRLEEKGVSLTESTLATAIAGVATQAAPIGLGKAIVAGSLAAVSVPSSASLAGTILRIMATSKTKAAAIAAMGVLSIPIAVLWMQNRDLRVEIDSLQDAVKQAALSPAATVPDGMALLDQNELDRLRGNYRELLTLRGTVARLTKELRDLNTTPSQPEPETDEMIESSNLDSVLFTSASTNRVRSGSTLVAGGWSKDGMRGYMLITPTIHDVEDPDTEKPLAFRSRLVLAPEAFWEGIGWEAATSETRRSTLCGVLNPEETLTLYNLVKESGGGDISNESAATSQDGGYVGLGWSMPDESGPGMLMMIDLRPWIVAGSDEVDIELTPSAVPDDSVVHSSLRSEPQRTHNPGDHQD